jgi:hypothetical protein
MWSFDATLRFVAFFRDWESFAAFKGGSFSRSDPQSSATSAADDGDVKIHLYTLSRRAEKSENQTKQLMQITYFNQKGALQKPIFKILGVGFVVCVEGL